MKTIQTMTTFAAAIATLVCFNTTANAQTINAAVGQAYAVPTVGQPTQQAQLAIETRVHPPTVSVIQPVAPKLGFSGQFIPGVGMKVLSVTPYSPRQAGLEYGDIVMTANGFTIGCQYDLGKALINAASHHGGIVTMRVKNIRGCIHRGDLYVNVTAYLFGQPQPIPVVAQVIHN